jgi:hypothetical protein
MHWLQDPNQSNVDNLNNVRSEVSRHFMNKKKEYLKDKIDELETNSKIKKNIRATYRGIRYFKTGYQPRRRKRVSGYRLSQCFGWVKELFLSAVQCPYG